MTALIAMTDQIPVLDTARLTLRAPSRFHAAYVQTHLEAVLLRACRDVDAEVSTIEIVA